jgi:phage shock protein PspC (stress-responsive transcriptional regulator)
MKKTLSISLANLNFVLEEDAYQKLVTYLEQIRIHFSNNPDKDEIVKDIEYSIADKFSKLLSPTKQVISIEDAERVMQEIGSTHDFTKTEMVNEEATSYTESEQTEKKRLYRDEEHQVIAGVCAGIANYFDVDVVWIRALFGVLLFTPLFGVVLIVYIILWLSTPPATNVVDKLKMQGEPVTLERIAAQIKDRVQQQDTPEKNIIKKIVSIPVIILTFVFKILKKVIPVLFLILASFATILVTGIILLITYVVGVILFFSNSPLVSLPLKDFPSTSLEYLSILLAYLAIILPLVFILSLFISIIKKRFILRTAGTISIVGSWVFIVLFGGILAVGLVPELQQKLRFDKEAQEVINLTEQNITNFDKVSILSHGNPRIQAKIIAGSEYKIIIKGKEDALGHVNFYKHTEGTLEGMLDVSYNDPAFICLGCHYNGVIQVEITMPTVKEIVAAVTSVHIQSGHQFRT